MRHDALTGAGVRLLTFNPTHLRIIAASRKKTDRRDAYWLARALQSGMMPHPVYIPGGAVRELRGLLHRREVIQRDYNRWKFRAKSQMRSSGILVGRGGPRARGRRVDAARLSVAFAADAAVCADIARNVIAFLVDCRDRFG